MPFRCLWASRWCESCVRIPPARTRKSQGEVREVRAIFGREAVGRPQARSPWPANGQLSVGRRHDLVREPNAGNPKERKMNSARKAATVVALGLASLAADAWDTGSEREVITEISKGYFHTCGIIRSNDSFESGSVKCWGDWGDDKYGQSTPPGGTFAQISAGWRHTCGLRVPREDRVWTRGSAEWGSVECWGDDKYGQSTPPGGTFTQISAGWRHTCGLRLLSGEEWGSVECWGTISMVNPRHLITSSPRSVRAPFTPAAS